MDDLCEPIWGHWQGALPGSTSRLCCNPSAREHEGAGSGRWVCQADTGGFTDHLFAISAILGFRFAPRIRDLTDRRLYAFTPAATCAELVPMIAGRIDERLIRAHWLDILRLAASVAAGAVVASHILRKLAAHPRQNGLALVLREVGRVERTLFILDWLTDRDLQRRAQIGLNLFAAAITS